MRLAFFALLTCLLPPQARAQSIFGSLQGSVSDESGAVIPSARVQLRNSGTGVALSGRSNDGGFYFFGELRPGNYTLEVEAQGFSKFIQHGITVRVEDRLRVDCRLKVGQVSESVEVTAQASLIQSESNTLGRVIEESTIKQLPLRGRNAFELVLLAPGAQQRGDDELPRLSGGRARTGEFVLDGGSITTPRRGQLFTQPNLDAIQEFKVQTSGLSAEFGRTVGGVVNATLKSGTNRLHGNLFEFHRNNSVNARNFFSDRNRKLIQNQFGGMAGGPIVKDRLFVFGDFESFRQAEETLFNLTLPTAAMKRGEFSEVRNQLFDPGTTRPGAAGRLARDPFPGNLIPASRFDPPGARAAALYPDPDRPGLAQNFQRLIPNKARNNKFDIRMDWRASDRDQVFGRWSWDHQFSDVARPFAASSNGGSRGNFNRYLTSAIGWTHTLTPATINDARVSFFRGIQERLLSLGVGETLGIPNLNIVGLPRIDVNGYAGLGDAQAFNPVENQYQVQDILTLVRGKHVVKTGADFRRFPINDLQLQFTGEYVFAANQTADPANPGSTGHPIASLLLGQANSFNNSTLRGRFYYRSTYFGAFLQDDYKVSPTLTVNAGLRYDVEQNPRELRQQGSNFDLRQGRPLTMEELGRNFIQFTDRVNFAPRIGFAWRPLGQHTVIRSHYGVFFIPLTGRATSAFARFPVDQRLGIQSDGINAAVILSRTPAITPSRDGKGFAIDTKDEHARLGSFQQWNFDVQHEVRGLLLQASYAGSAGRHLMLNQDYNVISIEQVQRAGRGTQEMRPYPDYGFILCHCEMQNSSYNALQLGLERRFQRGLFWSVSYTFSKFLDYNEDNFSSMFPMDPYNLRLERGLSQSHFPHRFVSAVVYDLPFRNSILTRGWQISGIVSLQSGDQVWITQATNTAQIFSRQFRPNLVANPILPEADRDIARWFDTAAFQAPPPRSLGTSAKFPGIEGPGLVNIDTSLIRFVDLPWREGMKVELRGDFFNVLNRTNFSPPSGTFGTPAFGRITGARTPRTLQFGAKVWW
jgi:hypothetical protein